MTKQEAIDIFGSASALADALGITDQAVSKWGDEVPELRVFQIRCIMKDRALGANK